MPTDGEYGGCGCPNGFGWNSILQECRPQAGQVCYSSDGLRG